MITKREVLKAEMKQIPENQAGERNQLKAKIMYIDADLQSEYYKILDERGEQVPSAAIAVTDSEQIM